MKKIFRAALAIMLAAIFAVPVVAATDTTIDGRTGDEWHKIIPTTLYDGKNNKETLFYFNLMWRVENNHLYVYAYIAEHLEANTTDKPGLILWIGNDRLKINFVDYLNRDNVSKSANAKYNLIYECVNEMAVQRRIEARVMPTAPIKSFRIAAISNNGWQTPTYTIDIPSGSFVTTTAATEKQPVQANTAGTPGEVANGAGQRQPGVNNNSGGATVAGGGSAGQSAPEESGTAERESEIVSGEMATAGATDIVPIDAGGTDSSNETTDKRRGLKIASLVIASICIVGAVAISVYFWGRKRTTGRAGDR